MPELRCDVQTCVHNKNFLCDLDRIQVGGRKATTAGETSCDSFKERSTENYSDSCADDTRKASPYSSVSCKAKECMYNKECECTAGKINVGGNDACSCDGTECATFQCK